MTKELVFVYGTLKKDGWNHSVMKKAKGEFMCNGLTNPWYDMLHLGGFPAMVNGKFRITGELYTVEDISPIDFLEGHPDYYSRSKIGITALIKPGPVSYPAWAYLLNPKSRDMKEPKVPGFNGVKQWSNVDDKRNCKAI